MATKIYKKILKTTFFFLILQAVDDAKKANVSVWKDLPEIFAKKSIVLTQLVLNMDFVSTVLVFAKKAGKAWIVVFWTKRPDNVSPIVQVMEFLTSRLKNAIALMAGSATIVAPNCAT